MNDQQIKGQWEQLKGSIKKTWGKLTDDDVALYEGEQQKFFGRVQELHGDAQDVAEKKITELKAKYSADNKAA